MKKLLSVVLVLSMLLSFAAPFASAQGLDNNETSIMGGTVYADNKVWFDLNGNAKLFIDTKAADYADRFTMQFLPGVDYSGFVAKPTGTFATDKAAITNPGYGGSAFPYTVDNNPKNPGTSTPADFKTDADGNLWYTFEENTYLVRPTENVIKVASPAVDTSLLSDEDAIKRYESLINGVTIDVPDGKYNNFGFFLVIRMSYSKGLEISFKYKEDAEAEKVNIVSSTYGTTDGDLYFKNLKSEDTNDWYCQHAFTRVVLDTNSSKTLESIHIKDNGVKNAKWPAFIISAWGEEQTLAEKITALEELNSEEITDNASYEAVKSAIADIDAYLTRHNTTLTVEQEAVYEEAKDLIEAYKITYVTAFDEAVEALGDTYSWDEEDKLNNAKDKYEALVDAGADENDAELLDKYNKIYEVYTKAKAIEETVAGWTNEYNASMYDGVIKAESDKENLKAMEEAADNVLAAEITEKIAKFNAIAIKAKAIEDKIDLLGDTFEASMATKLNEIADDILGLKELGGNENDAINETKLEKYNGLNEAYQASKGVEELVKEIEDQMAEIGETYEYAEKVKVETVNTEYEELIKNHPEAAEKFTAAIVEKFKKVYEDYKTAKALEETVAQWNAYTASLYSEVIDAKAKADVLGTAALSEDDIIKINEFNTLAVAAKEIDNRIALLGDTYLPSMNTELKAIKKAIEELNAADDAFENIGKFNTLYDAYEEVKVDLTAPQTEYLSIPFTNDAFATVADIYKYYPRKSDFTVFPSKDVDGNNITNHVNGYFKTKTLNNKLFVIDAILGNEEGKYSGDYLNATEEKKQVTYKFKVNGNSKFELKSTETDGTMNFLYNHKGIPFKMGPIGGTGVHLTSEGGYNVHVLPSVVEPYLTNGKVENPESVNILMSSHTVDGGGNAGLFPVEITYADGTTVTKYVLSTLLVPNSQSRTAFMEATGGSANNAGDGDRLAKTIIYVPKTTDITSGDVIKKAEKILTETNSEEIIGKAITLEDVVFPNDDLIIKGESVLFGDYNLAETAGFNNGRQWCNVGYADFLQIPVDKKVTSIQMKRNVSAILNWKDEEGNTVAVKNGECAYIPVTIEGASEDYYYFAKLGSLLADKQEVYGVTISGKSLQEEVDALEERIEALDATYNPDQKDEIAAIKLEIGALQAKGVEDSDFGEGLIEKLNGLYAAAEDEIKAAQISAIESKITAISRKYSSSMRAEVEEIKAALIQSGFEESEFNQDIITKFNKVYAVYEIVAKLEDEVSGWGSEYLYTIYEDVVAAKALKEEVIANENAAEDAISSSVLDKLEKMAAFAEEATGVDAKINSLDTPYNKEQLETIIAIKADIDTFKANGGTDNGLAYIAKFNAIYEAAKPDLLQRDVDIAVEKINTLPALYSSSLDALIFEIETLIKSIQERGGVIPADAAAKLKAVTDQRDEVPVYEMFKLPYNKDVVESVDKYLEQYKNDKGVYVKDSNGHFVVQVKEPWTFTAFIRGVYTAKEEDFVSKLGVDLDTNQATVEGIPYQFGKLKSTVNGAIDAEGNSMTSSVATNVTVDVPNNAYSKIHAAMWAYTDMAGVSVIYKYADGTSSTETNVTKIAGGQSIVSQLVNNQPNYYKLLSESLLGYRRAYEPAYDKTDPVGGYSFAITDHILTPDDNKILDKIEFVFSTADAHVFAITGQVAHAVLLNKVLEDTVANLDKVEEKAIREVLKGCTNIMGTLDEKEASYDAAVEEKVTENKNIFVAVEEVTTYTDLDNMTYTIKFSGPVADTSITKTLFAVNKNGEAFTDYEIVPVEVDGEIREVKVVVKNDFDYDSQYELSISKDVTGTLGKTILTGEVKEYDANPAVNAETSIENGEGTIKLTNNMNEPQEVTALVAVYGANNQIVSKVLVNKVLAVGESILQAVEFELAEGQTVECLVLDSLTNCRKIFNTYISK